MCPKLVISTVGFLFLNFEIIFIEKSWKFQKYYFPLWKLNQQFCQIRYVVYKNEAKFDDTEIYFYFYKIWELRGCVSAHIAVWPTKSKEKLIKSFLSSSKIFLAGVFFLHKLFWNYQTENFSNKITIKTV